MVTTPRGRRTRRARHALRGVSHGRRVARETRPDSGSPRPDETVISLVEEPFTSVDDAHRRLSTLERHFRVRGDRRGAFLAVYARVTGAVGRRIDDGVFHDDEWVRSYLIAFADLYRQALYAYESGDVERVPAAWRIAFEHAERGEGLVAQDTVLGINAHVNYDLALALDAVGVGPDRRRRYDDHCAVNEVLHRLVDDVQARVAEAYAPGLAGVDEGLGRVDETLSYLALSEGRESAWRSAVALSAGSTLRRRLARWTLATTSTGVAHLVCSPTRSSRVRRVLRRVERGPAGRHDDVR